MKRLNRLKPQEGKRFVAPDSTSSSTEHLCPVFSLRYLSRDYCISKCTTEEQISFVETIRLLSQQTWAQIKTNNRHKLGCEKIARSSMQAAIPSVVTADVTLLAFRFSGMAPM